MMIKSLMTRNVEAIAPDQSLQCAAEMMKSLDVGAIPVCNGKSVVGMVTDRDIAVRGVARGLDPNSTRVRDVMTDGFIYCREEDTVEDAARLMEQKQIRRLPVIDRENCLIGIVSLGDLATRARNDRMSGEVLEQVSQPGIQQTA